MPLILKEKLDPEKQVGDLGLWRIEETETQLLQPLALDPGEREQLSAIKGSGRRKEYLAARCLLHELSGRKVRGALIKDNFGKPHLVDSDHQISLSHTQGLSAAVAHPRPCGVDVQLFVPKINRLAPRFVGAAEAAELTDANRLIFQHLIWSAKEAVYKAYGRKEVDFREHLFVELSGIPLEAGTTTASLRKGELSMNFRIDYRIFERNYMLATAIQL